MPTGLMNFFFNNFRAGRGYKSMSELKSKGDTSSLKEKSSSTLSVVKSIVLREKDEKLIAEEEEEIQLLASCLFKSGTSI
jgi:hypothetical protein